MAASAAAAQSLPSGASVTAGSATVTTSGPNLLVNQTSQNAIISWGSFSVGGNATAHFENGAGATLNRVTGNLPSSIDGTLTATGSLYLINPAGVAIGTGGMVRTGGSFVASTHDATDADFLDGGDLTLKGSSKAEIVNRGFVTSLSGDVVLTARRVENSGAIEAPEGSVGLLGGYEVLLRDTSLADGKFAVKVGGTDTEVVNTGTVRAAEIEMRANGGSVQALAGNTKAIVKATGVNKVGGRIFLTAGNGGTVKATQRIVARRAVQPAQKAAVAALPETGPLPATRPDFEGGEVHIAAGTVDLGGVIDVAGAGAGGGTITATAPGGSLSLAATAALDASGGTGGLVLLGGDYQGGADPATRYLDMSMERAAATSVAAGATITADGSEGDGGAVVVWSDGATTVKGQITAKGGATGDGGTIETSGHTIDFTDARIDASAQNGLAGTWLIDPADLLIGKAAAETAESMLNNGTNAMFATRASSAGGPKGYVTSTGPGDITVAAPITWSTGATLTLDAYHSIAINAPITVAGNGGLALLTNQAGGTGGTLSFAGGVQYTGSGGSLTINSLGYELLYSMDDLQGINTNARLGGNYALAKSLDAGAITGWKPLGTNGANGLINGGLGFAGRLTGLGNTISNLTVDIGDFDHAGLFGISSGTISDIGLVGGSVKGGLNVGGLVGLQAGGTIERSYATGEVNGTDYNVGGLVGMQSDGIISQAYATGSVSGAASYVGGLVGYQANGTIERSYATGAVNGTDYNVGGLVGMQSDGIITQAYATGAVSGRSDVGGLVGSQGGGISQAYATGAISGTIAGGLVGTRLGGALTSSYFDSYSTGQAVAVGSGLQTGVAAVTSNPNAGNSAYQKSTYANAGWTFTDTVGSTGDWFMIEGQTRPFGAWEYSTAIANSHQLQLVNMDLDASYQLARSLDLTGEFGRAGVASPTEAQSAGMWNRGFVPLGTNGAGGVLGIGGKGFSGDFNGLGNTISNLIVDIGTNRYAGLFGRSQGAISDIGLVGGSVKGSVYAGGLVGNQSGGSISQSYATSAVSGVTSSVGGLVGWQASGSISQSYATGAVSSAGDSVGGLVGWQSSGNISQSYATGAVSGDKYVGGLVGLLADGSVSEAYATGTVDGTVHSVGGLVGGQASGSISQSYATGAVSSAGDSVGGLVGWQSSGNISQSYATGMVSGAGHTVGGLVGWQSSGNISQSYATGMVSGAGHTVGGLVGRQGSGNISQSYATGAVSGGEDSVGGLVGWQESGSIHQAYATGAVSGASYAVGGLVGWQSSGNISQVYATGAVLGSSNVGGLVGLGGGYVPAGYFDGQTTGQSGLGSFNTAMLQAALPVGFDPAVWGILPSQSYPYFNWRFPDGPSVVSGAAIDIAGDNDRLGVGLGIDGKAVAYGHTGANGYYNFMVDPVAAGSSAITWLTGERFAGGTTASRANAVGEMPASGLPGFGQGVARGLDLYAGTVNVKTALPTYTAIAAMMDRGLYGDGTGAPLSSQVPDGSVLLYDSGVCVCVPGIGVNFDPYTTGRVNARIEAGAPLLTWDSRFDVQPLKLTLLAAGNVLVTSDGSIAAGEIMNIGGGSLTMAVKGDLSMDADASIDAFGKIDITVDGNVDLGGMSGSSLQISGADTIRFSTGGNFTMAPGTHLAAYGAGDALQLAIGGKFDNGSGPDGLGEVLLVNPNNARWLVYLASPNDGHTFGVLDSANTAVWNTGAFGAVAAAGNRYVFSHQPTLTFTSLDATKTYGETGTAFDFAVSGLMPGVAGAYLGDTLPSAYTGAPQLSSFGDTAGATVAGGPYAVTIADNGLTSAIGYKFGFASSGLLTVNRRALTVKVSDADKIYDGLAWSGGNGVSYSGFVNGEDASVLGGTLGWGGTAQGAKDAGSYTLVASGLTSGNYDIGYIAGQLTVTPRAITVTADDLSRLLGQPDPALTWTISSGSLASFDTVGGVFSGTLARQAGEAPGDYDITQGRLAANTNYAMVFVPGILTIIQPQQYTESRGLERQGGDDSLPSVAGESGGDTTGICADGVLGPDCAAHVNAGNRDLGPYIGMTQ